MVASEIYVLVRLSRASIIFSPAGRSGQGAPPEAPERKDALSESIRQTKPALTTPPAFESFWKRTVRELDALDPEAASEPDRRQPYRQLELRNMRFRSWGGVRIAGYRLFWQDDRPRPLVVHGHGYNSRYSVQWLWALQGLNVVGVDIRGFGRSRKAVERRSPWGFMLTGFESPEAHMLRGAVCDYIQAARVGHGLARGRTSSLVFRGFSFSGALALMAQAATQRADLLAIGTPTFGWHDGRNELARAGSAVEVRRFHERQPRHAAAIRDTLRYFDSMNFAPLIRSPTLLGIGRRDIVVPPATVYAIRNRFECPLETMEFPVSHTDEPEEAEWERFDVRWTELALEGIPRGFGAPAGNGREAGG